MTILNERVDDQHEASCTIENTIPVLAVADMQASICFYRDVLAFETDWGGTNELSHIASVSRDGHAIMLQKREQASPGCVWIGASMLTSLWDKIRLRADVCIVQRPTNQPWALEMKIKDLDENILWFGSEPLESVPFGHEVMDL